MPNENIQHLPLRSLVLADTNVRSTPAPEDAAHELEASIAANGLIQNLTVRPRPNGNGTTYAVISGGRRLEALQALARKRRAKITLSTLIPCRVIDDDATVDEVLSLTENATRVDMHPIDQVTAFRTLSERRLTTKAIANRFGLTVRTVERRLRLAGVAPAILEAAKLDQLSRDHLEAFATTADQTRQLELWNRMKNRADTPAPSWIRTELKSRVLSAATAVARFVGLKVYKRAGGKTEVDLFGEDDAENVQILDVPLLKHLAFEKLDAAAKALGPGWRWTKTLLEADWNATHAYGTIKGEPIPPTAEQNAALATVTTDLAAIRKRLDDDAGTLAARDRAALQREHDDLAARAERLDAAMYSGQTFTPEQKACSGCLLTIDQRGELQVHQGLVKPEDEYLVPKPPPPPEPPPEPAPEPAAASTPPPAANDPVEGGGEVPVDGEPPIDTSPAATPAPPAPTPTSEPPHRPAAANPEPYTPPQGDTSPAARTAAATREVGLQPELAGALRLVRTTLVKAHLAADFTTAFDLLTYHLTMLLYGSRLKLGLTTISASSSPDVPEDLGREAADAFEEHSPGIELLHDRTCEADRSWINIPDDRKRFEAFRALGRDARERLLAVAVAETLTPQLAFDPDARAETESVIESLAIPFDRLYRPTPNGFWLRLPRTDILAIAEQVLGSDWAKVHAQDRKNTLAAAMAAAFGPDDPPAGAGVADEARARALRWTPPGFLPAPPPAAATTTAATRAPDAVPDWMND